METIALTLDELNKVIDLARGISDSESAFTAEDISGCTEVCTYDWEFEFSNAEIIEIVTSKR